LKKRKFSRRHFVAVSSAAAAGAWFSLSSRSTPRLIRQAIQETRRPVALPRHKPEPAKWNDREITAAWLGHSTVLINFFGLNILTDPVLFPRVGADLGFATIGPKRLVASPLAPGELPRIDLVLLSHAHLDHFDMRSLQQLHSTTKAVTAASTRDLFSATALRDVTELRWGESINVATAHGDVNVSAFEVNHWGARWRHDKHRGYNGYILERDGKRILFGGDTAMTDKFKLIRGQRPFDLAIMPIGSYKPFKRCHCTPEESVAMTNDAGAERLLPIHFKTFRLGEEGTTEPLERLDAVMSQDRIALRGHW
jgi:L-ascorbate metabolism protein UlaG (beta-lactamase superfamily)